MGPSPSRRQPRLGDRAGSLRVRDSSRCPHGRRQAHILRPPRTGRWRRGSAHAGPPHPGACMCVAGAPSDDL